MALAIRADQPPRAVDPGVRADRANAGAPVAGVDSQYFRNTRAAFQETHSIAGDLESGSGLGPRFNATSCGGCHAYPAAGGSSPKVNPQLAMAVAHGAQNRIPDFIRPDGPVLAVRVRKQAPLAQAGEVLPLFTVNGRTDAYSCKVEQPDFTDRANLAFRIPTPVFGAGLIDNIPDAAILSNGEAHAAEKRKLGIHGEPNRDSSGEVGRFGWKAQHHSLAAFAGDAYQTEMGVPNEVTGYRRASLSTTCYTLYEAAYDDPNYSASYDQNAQPTVFLFTEFMRFLEPPRPVKEFPGATAESIGSGRRLFDRAGCGLCHTPALRTDNSSDLAALNGRDAQLYSDLLLHEMGPKLADGIRQGRAGPDQFRTAPLWGLGQRIFFLHDGRTADLMVAIQEHAGEAAGTIAAFNRLSASEQQDILNFLRSL